MTAFLILIPFTGGFSEVDGDWRPVYIITFVCALLSMVLCSPPPPPITASTTRCWTGRTSRRSPPGT
jgi:hypothetical protein